MFSFLKKKTEEEKELIKNSSKISKGLSSIFVGKKVDEKSLEELEELLLLQLAKVTPKSAGINNNFVIFFI